MTTAQCSNCFFSFVAPADADSITAIPPAQTPVTRFAGSRFCNRNAPLASNQNPTTWLWPQVQDDFWCGEGADSATGLAYGAIVNGLPGQNGAGYTAVSTTSFAVASSGSISPTITANCAYTAGARVRFSSRGTAATWVEGIVTAYDQGTGAMTFTADLSSGSGSHTDWDINLAGNPGASGSGVVTSGSFTFTTSPLTILDASAPASASKIFLQPTNNEAVTLVAGITGTNPGQSAGPFVSAVVAGVSFTVTGGQSGGGGPTGTETFAYLIVS